jgi:hypothetical protein
VEHHVAQDFDAVVGVVREDTTVVAGLFFVREGVERTAAGEGEAVTVDHPDE